MSRITEAEILGVRAFYDRLADEFCPMRYGDPERRAGLILRCLSTDGAYREQVAVEAIDTWFVTMAASSIETDVEGEEFVLYLAGDRVLIETGRDHEVIGCPWTVRQVGEVLVAGEDLAWHAGPENESWNAWFGTCGQERVAAVGTRSFLLGPHDLVGTWVAEAWRALVTP